MALGRKTGGRSKGTPNKRTQQIADIIQKKRPSFNPILKMVDIIQDETVPIDIRAHLLSQLMQYLHPKYKPVADESNLKEIDLPMINYIEFLDLEKI